MSYNSSSGEAEAGRSWGLIASSRSSHIHKLLVKRKTLSQKTRGRMREEDTWHQHLASTYTHAQVHMNLHTQACTHTSIWQSFSVHYFVCIFFFIRHFLYLYFKYYPLSRFPSRNPLLLPACFYEGPPTCPHLLLSPFPGINVHWAIKSTQDLGPLLPGMPNMTILY